MFCSQCGAPMGDNDKFCGCCGAPNVAAGTAAQPQAQQAPQVDPQPAVPPKPKGCLAQAFHDMTKVPGVFKRVCQIGFLPALIGIVSVIALFIPVVGGILAAIGLLLAYIAGVCGSGFGIEWGRDLSLGKTDGMDRPLLRSTSFGLGIFSSVIGSILKLIAAIPVVGVVISAVETAVLGAAGSYYYYGSDSLGAIIMGSLGLLVLAFIVSAVLGVFFTMFSEITVMHFAVTGRVESAFSLNKVWKSFKHNKTKLFCAAILPEFLVGIVANVAIWILTAIFGAVAGMGMYSYGFGYYSHPTGFAAIVAAGGLLLVISLVLAVFIGVFSNVFGTMLKHRAVGYWAARYASEWADEGDDVLTFVLPGEKKPAPAVVDEVATAEAVPADDSEPATAEPATVEPEPTAEPVAAEVESVADEPADEDDSDTDEPESED